jgi:hypothetical protein
LTRLWHIDIIRLKKSIKKARNQMTNTAVLIAIASHKELVINTCLETMYDDQIEIDKVASIVVESLGFDVMAIAKVWADVEAIETLIKAIWENSLTGVWADACKDMTDFIATLTPVQPKAVTVIATTANPLSNQLKALTGDGWNWFDWEGNLTDSNNIIKHVRTGLVVQVL